MHVDGERQVYTGCAQAIPSDGGNPVRRKRPPTAVRKRKMVTIGNRLELDSLKRRPVLSDLGSLDEILLGADRKSRELESTVVEVRPPTPLRFDSVWCSPRSVLAPYVSSWHLFSSFSCARPLPLSSDSCERTSQK